MKAVIWTDTVQVVIMFVSVAVVSFLLFDSDATVPRCVKKMAETVTI